MADLPPSYASFTTQSAVSANKQQKVMPLNPPRISNPRGDNGNPTITINGELIEIPSTVGPLTSLAQFIRSNTKYSGTKISCNEGMCGACTVMISYTNPATGETESHGVNGCLRPVVACAGMSVLTNDGLVTKDPKSLSYTYNEIQTRLADHNGSQCGYCSNGFVMNMYDFLHNNPNPTALDIERAFDGNLCRCTGYRPILDAMQTFGPNSVQMKKVKHDDCSEDDCRKKGCQRRQKVFPDLEDVSQFIKTDHHKHFDHTDTAAKLNALPMPMKNAAVKSTDPYNNQWQEMSSIAELNATLKGLGPNSQALVVNATTSFGVFRSDRNLTNTNYVYIGNVPEMRQITSDTNNVYVGGAATIDAVIRYLSAVAVPSAAWKTKHFPQAVAHLKRIAGRQVRNAGSLAGNIMTALNHQLPNNFFASDGSIVLMGLGATVNVYDAIADREYAWDMPTFFTMSGKMVGKYISKITIPFASNANEIFMSYKIAMRQQGAHAVINAAMKATPTAAGTIAASNDVIVAIGGVEVTPVRYTAVEKFLSGTGTNSFTDNTFIKNAVTLLQGLLVFAPMGGREAFRSATALNCLYKFFLALNPNLAPDLASGAECWNDRPVSVGSQLFTPVPSMYPVTKAITKVEAPFQTSGLAKYANDLHAKDGILQARIVVATQANATLVSMDASAAEQLPGFVKFITAADMIEGTNDWSNGAILTPVGSHIDFVGQVIGIVVARDDITAWLAAYSVATTYSNGATPITTIAQAVQANSYSTNVPPPVVRGDAAATFASSAIKVTGSVQMGPQIHMFMENHNTTCTPRDGEFEVQSATQMPVSVQMICAQVAGVQTSKVTVSTKLVGGGFGGKIGNSTHVAALAALASSVTDAPVTMLISQDQTSHTYGFRDVKVVNYQAGLNADGTFNSLSISSLNACGAANTDEFGDVLTFLHSVDNCYKIPNVNFEGKMLITNYAPVAACRGPGWVHAVHVMESIMSDISSQSGIDATALREANFFKQGDETADGMLLQYWSLPSVWSQLKASAGFAEKTAAITAFNAANRWRKRGLSMVPVRFGVGLAGANYDSLIAIYPDGTVGVTHGGNEIGQGINTRMAQVVGYKLGIPADDIKIISVKPTCTASISAGSNVTGGSVTAEMCAASLLHAAETLNRRLSPFKKAGQTWAELIAAASAAMVPLTATGWTNAPTCPGMFNYNVCAASLTVAEVDILTGQTEVISTDMVYDCGQSTSPLLDIGQIEGGFVFGMGMLMTEENTWDPVTAEPTAPTHWKYKIPCSMTIPEEFNITLLKDAPNPLGTLGSKGTGEPGVCMAASVPQAVESAITAARAANGLGSKRWVCGVYPLTIDKSQQACGVTVDNLVV